MMLMGMKRLYMWFGGLSWPQLVVTAAVAAAAHNRCVWFGASKSVEGLLSCRDGDTRTLLEMKTGRVAVCHNMGV